MIVSTSDIQEEQNLTGLKTFDSMIELILTKDRTRANYTNMTTRSPMENVEKNFIFTVNPTIANYHKTFHTMALASRLSKFIRPPSLSPKSRYR